MKLKKRFELILVIAIIIFSGWLMGKSFGYNPISRSYWVARNEVGDFGLHLALTRSFSIGNNFPPESPFFPGPPLPYHYGFDLIAGMLEKAGIRLDLAVNLPSLIFFTLIIWLVYKLTPLITGQGRLSGLVAVILFIFPGSTKFWTYLFKSGISASTIRELWRIPDYLRSFSGDSSLYFTLNVFLNQRHLIAGMALSLLIIYILINNGFVKDKKKLFKQYLLVGVIWGISIWFHNLLFIADGIIIASMLIFSGKLKQILPIILGSLVFILLKMSGLLNLVSQSGLPIIWHPGFLAGPLTFLGIMSFWWQNLSLALFTIPLGIFITKKKTKPLIFALIVIFLMANLLQLSYRPEHNHAWINLVLIIGNIYSAGFLVYLWNHKAAGKALSVTLLLIMTFSGITDLFAIKNDFHYPIPDFYSNKLMYWIKNNTSPKSIFLAEANLYDPVTLSGRRNYLGPAYYLDVMGYRSSERAQSTSNFWQTDNRNTLIEIRNAGINYIILPLKPGPDFKYQTNMEFWNQNLKLLFEDENYQVFKL